MTVDKYSAETRRGFLTSYLAQFEGPDGAYSHARAPVTARPVAPLVLFACRAAWAAASGGLNLCDLGCTFLAFPCLCISPNPVLLGACLLECFPSTCTLISTIGLDELNTSGLTVYPNPTMGSIKIQSKEELLGTNYAIHDASGRILLQGSLDSKQVISVESLSSGTYILRLDQGEKGQIRIVKE